MASTDLPPTTTQIRTIPPTPKPTPGATSWPISRQPTTTVTPPIVSTIPPATPSPTLQVPGVSPSTPAATTTTPPTTSPSPTWQVPRSTPSTSAPIPTPLPIPAIKPTPTRAPISLTPPTPSSPLSTTPPPYSSSPTDAPVGTSREGSSSPIPATTTLAPTSSESPDATAQTTPDSKSPTEPIEATVPQVSSPIGLSTIAPSTLGSNGLTALPSLAPGPFPPGLSYSAPPPSSALGQSNSSSSKLVLSITAPLVACLALAVGLFLWHRNRQHKASQTTPSTYSSGDDLDDSWLQLEAYRVDMTAIELEKRIAMGSFGEVWLATFQKQVVAVKTCSHTSSLEIHSFVNELLLMSTFKSPHIVTFMGAAWMKPTDVKAVLEYMNLGDLRQFLADTTPSSFSWPAKLECALHVARALVYLKSKHVIHRDLKSRNVLLDSAKGTKLGDFGISRLDSNESMTTGVGTYRWMAPEILTFRRFLIPMSKPRMATPCLMVL
ncbi:hypothetical protein AeMF1_013624 [Aphanomyces euteiches]|nr:hypothetical protein AeMF1_013624 [Aphanomyces euteiches]KAH9182206.1 hypothetical protein AeNC1_015818 [Aphanomyces euteiches]